MVTVRLIAKENNIEYLYELKPHMNLNALYGEKHSICQSEFISDSFSTPTAFNLFI